MSTRRRWIALALLFVIIEATYVFIVSAGTFTNWPTGIAFYDQLAEGFRAGHLYLLTKPAPELLAAANPGDPSLARFWVGDASLFEGRYYIYWGPAPALFLAAIKTMFRISREVGDQYPVFAAFSLSALCGLLIIERMVKHLFAAVPFALVAASALAFALGNPVLHMLASSSVYMAAIASGQAFLLLGLVFALDLVLPPVRARPDGETRLPRAWKLAATGAAWAFALACRLTLAPAVLLLTLTLVARLTPSVVEPNIGPTGPSVLTRRFWWAARVFAWIAAPIVLGCLVLGAYNKLRFHSWLDTGIDKQLSTWHFRYSPHFYPANIYTYLFRRFSLSCHFPFTIVPYETELARAVPSWIPFQYDYIAPEPVTGLLVAFPVAWLIPAAVRSAVRAFRRLRAARRSAPRDTATLSDQAFDQVSDQASDRASDRTFVWLTLSFAVMGTVTMIAPAGEYFATMRFIEDMTPGLALLGVLGMGTLFTSARASRAARRLVLAGCLTIATVTIAIGLLHGYQGYGNHFERNNPSLATELHKRLSVCR